MKVWYISAKVGQEKIVRLFIGSESLHEIIKVHGVI